MAALPPSLAAAATDEDSLMAELLNLGGDESSGGETASIGYAPAPALAAGATASAARGGDGTSPLPHVHPVPTQQEAMAAAMAINQHCG